MQRRDVALFIPMSRLCKALDSLSGLNNFYIDPTALVLQALSNGFHHAFDIMNATALPSGISNWGIEVS